MSAQPQIDFAAQIRATKTFEAVGGAFNLKVLLLILTSEGPLDPTAALKLKSDLEFCLRLITPHLPKLEPVGEPNEPN